MFKKYKLGDLCTMESGSREKGGALFNGIPSIGGEQINSDGTINVEKMKFISEEHFAKMKQGKLKEQDVLLVKDGATTGKAAYYNANFPKAAVNEHVFILRANEKILPKLLFYKISSKEFQNTIKSKIRGIIGGINLSIKNINLEIPESKNEQKEIVKILDCVSEIIRLRNDCINSAQSLIPALFQEMFGDTIKNTNKYEKYRIKDLGTVITGTTPSSKKENMFGGKIPFIAPGDLELDTGQCNRYVTEEGAKNSRKVRSGATLVCCIGATIGKVDRTIIDSCFNQQINAIDWDNEKIDDIFGMYLFRQIAPLIREKSSHTTLPILNKSNFENIQIVKPEMRQQKIFAQKVIEIEEYIQEQQKELKNAENMFQSLLHYAFTGELTKNKYGEINEET